jgi:hypothetical protein
LATGTSRGINGTRVTPRRNPLISSAIPVVPQQNSPRRLLIRPTVPLRF